MLSFICLLGGRRWPRLDEDKAKGRAGSEPQPRGGYPQKWRAAATLYQLRPPDPENVQALPPLHP